MTIGKSDPVLWALILLFLWIAGESIHFMYWPDSARLPTYTAVVTYTLLPLFIATATVKVTYVAGQYILRKFPDR